MAKTNCDWCATLTKPQKLIDSLAYQTADLLCSCLLANEAYAADAAGRPKRTWLFVWEKRALLDIDEYRKRKTSIPINSWTVSFLETNLENIKNDLPIDWDLRSARERRESND